MSDTPSAPDASPEGSADTSAAAAAPPFDLNALQGLEEVAPAAAAAAPSKSPEVEEATVVAAAAVAADHTGGNAPPEAASGPPAPDVLARVVASWHNRWPWARRLHAAEVSGVGLVQLHFEAAGDGLGAALFQEPALVPGVSRAQLERLTRRHGFVEPPGEVGWPVRMVGTAPAQGGAVRYLMTASVPAAVSGATPLRLLVGRSHEVRWLRRTVTPVQGRRALDRRRALGTGGLLLGLLLIAAALGWWWSGRGPAGAAHSAAPVASAASSQVAASEAGHAPSAAAAESSSEPASAPAAASLSASAALAELAASEAGPASTPAMESAAVTSHWALVSQPYRRPDRQAADLRLLKAAAAALPGDVRVDILHTADGPILTLWPLPDPVSSGLLAERLARQGLSLRTQEF